MKLPALLVCSIVSHLSACSSTPADAPLENIEISSQDRGTLPESELIKGRDGGYSARIFDRSVWVFGDTILKNADSEGSSWRHNSFAYTEDTIAQDGVTGFVTPTRADGSPRELFSPTTEEAAFNQAHAGENCLEKPCGARKVLWPASLVWDSTRNRALLFYIKIYGEPGPFNFHSLGVGLAEWNSLESGPQRPEANVFLEEPTLLFSNDEPPFGTAAIIEGEHLYSYGCSGGLSKACKLARVPTDKVFQRNLWQYYDGEGWGHTIGKAKELFDASTMMSVFYNSALQRYVAIYSKNLENRIMMRTSLALEGPWSEETELAQAQAPTDGGAWAYSGLAHPEFAEDNGLIQYISYYRGLAPFQGELRLVRVSFQRVVAN